jgi:hypothetical protein
MIEVTTAIGLVKSVILLFGGAITYIAYKAYRRTSEQSLKMLSVGFGIITVGALLTGAGNQFFSVSLELGVLINSIFVAVGLGVIMYSLYMQD